MIAHQAVGVTVPIEPLHHLAKDLEELFSITVIVKDDCPCVTTRGDMIDSAGEFYA